MKETGASSPQGWKVEDIHWRAVGSGYAIGILITLIAGLPLLVALQSSWLLAFVGMVGVLAGAFVTGRKVGLKLAPINGALMSIAYHFTAVLVFFAGWLLQWLPEPLPGLPQGDSTFYFAWPLAQFVFSVVGAMLGARTKVKVAMGGS